MNLQERLQQLAQQREQLFVALHEVNRTILMIEGGIQFAQIALKKHESANQPLGTVELNQQAKTVMENCERKIHQINGGIEACEDILKPDENPSES